MTAAARRLKPLGWMSTSAKHGASHFILEDGASACSRAIWKDGVPAHAPITSELVPRDPRRHLCHICRRLHPGEVCVCSKCTTGIPTTGQLR